jgi:predicted SAM-dependent methyltransferase
MTKLNLGCCHVIKEGFINYDIAPGPGGVVQDLTKPLPHANESVDLIVSEHFLEHITRPQALGLLKECYRVLKPGARCRTTVPGLKIVVEDYVNGYRDRYGDMLKMDTPCQMLNNSMRNWGHQHLYDLEDLMLLYKEAGFTIVNEAPHGEYEVRNWMCEITIEGTK